MTIDPALEQPYLHDMLSATLAPSMAIGPRDGQLRGAGLAGIYIADQRILHTFLLTLAGVEPVAIASAAPTGDSCSFTAVARNLGDPGPDPTVLVQRHRQANGATFIETITVRNYARSTVYAELRIELGTDFADMSEVKSGKSLPAVKFLNTAQGYLATSPHRNVAAFITAEPNASGDGATGLNWQVEVKPHAQWSVRLTIGFEGDPPSQVVVGAPAQPSWKLPQLSSDRLEFTKFFERSLADLHSLRLSDPQNPADVFFAAGVPWYLTLFGRDSLWAARMMLPLGTTMAAGTLRTLARRQGVERNVRTAEEPGKILHEIRNERAQSGTGDGSELALPPVYYGTVDATALWVCLLADAWRWGMPRDEVSELMPTLVRALAWIRDSALDERGFLAYFDPTGRGLSNQGWKDSDDSVQFRDGTLARGPVALCEAQAYAVEAARAGAELMDAFGLTGGSEWRELADSLSTRFRRHYWVAGYPAIALDGTGAAVDALTSNIGHLLGTGLLNQEESRRVAVHLGSEELNSGYGLRTMAISASGYNPLSYHCGSVWTHDTAIAIRGLVAIGDQQADRAARQLIDGLLNAAPFFDYRVPELFGGGSIQEGPPLPYPASCTPQAWSAAAAVVILQALLGLTVDVPAATISLAPLTPSPVGALQVRGLQIAGANLDVALSADGVVTVLAQPPGFTVSIRSR